jgi:hypothetical protein
MGTPTVTRDAPLGIDLQHAVQQVQAALVHFGQQLAQVGRFASVFR